MTLEYRCSNCGTLLQTTNADAVDAEIERLTARNAEHEARYDALEAKEEFRRREVERLRAALKECADDLASELDGRYAGMLDHPAMKRRYDRDMESVISARFLLDGVDEQEAP